MGFGGINIRQTGDRLIFRAFLLDLGGNLVTTGTTTLTLLELQGDGSAKTYDFDSNTFKTKDVATPTLAMTHRTGNNGSTNTGLWTAALTTLTGFTDGAVYFAKVANTLASPPVQMREIQFGGTEGNPVYVTGTVADETPAAGEFTANTALSTVDNFYQNQVLVFVTGSLSGIARKISGYTGSTRTVTLASNFPAAPANGDKFFILGYLA